LLRAFLEARPELLQALTQHLGNRDEAQDAVQDAFLKCWRRRRGVGRVRNLRAWVFRVGLNAARDLVRSAWRRRSRPLLIDNPLDARPSASPTDTAEKQEDLERLRRALQDLRQDEREVFLLRQNSDLTYEEIAGRRRVPVGTVKTQMRTALIKLRAALAPEPR
jgi:RNA polymerase sigma-70 factor (ECF subfamily)